MVWCLTGECSKPCNALTEKRLILKMRSHLRAKKHGLPNDKIHELVPYAHLKCIQNNYTKKKMGEVTMLLGAQLECETPFTMYTLNDKWYGVCPTGECSNPWKATDKKLLIASMRTHLQGKHKMLDKDIHQLIPFKYKNPS